MLDHFSQRTDFARLVGEVHGAVGLFPVAKNAKTNEVGLLAFDLLAGISTATLAGQVRRLVFAEGGFDLVLNRQAVAIPARNVRRVIAGQRFRAGDNVFENLVNRVTDVNAAVGVGRAIVQEEFWTAFAHFTQLLIQTNIVPALQGLRLARRQASLHRKLGIRQV